MKYLLKLKDYYIKWYKQQTFKTLMLGQLGRWSKDDRFENIATIIYFLLIFGALAFTPKEH